MHYSGRIPLRFRWSLRGSGCAGVRCAPVLRTAPVGRALSIPCALPQQQLTPGGPAAVPDSPPAPIPKPRPHKATPSHRPPCSKSTAPRFSCNRTGQLPGGQPTAPRYLPSAGGQKRPPATTTPIFSCCRVGGCRAAGPEKAGPRHPLVAADAKDSPTTSTARHPFASPLKVCRFINRQHGGFHAQANARSSSSARRGPSGNRCSSGYSGGASQGALRACESGACRPQAPGQHLGAAGRPGRQAAPLWSGISHAARSGLQQGVAGPAVLPRVAGLFSSGPGSCHPQGRR